MTRINIATRTYRNGRFGDNTASLVRVISDSQWLPSGYSVGDGSSDPFFYTCPVKAKNAFRSLLARVA